MPDLIRVSRMRGKCKGSISFASLGINYHFRLVHDVATGDIERDARDVVRLR